jgi:hypothetical protein
LRKGLKVDFDIPSPSCSPMAEQIAAYQVRQSIAGEVA